MKILVTGATGFVGSVLVPLLVKRFGADSVAAYILPGEKIPDSWRGEPVTVSYGDITDAGAVARACRGRTHVIHLAGLISYWPRDRHRLMAVNQEGVRAVVEGCLAASVSRLVHISSVGAVGFEKKGRPVTEDEPFNWPKGFYYMISKRLGQETVERAVRERGLPAVILNPASIMGPGDENPRTAHNRLYASVYRGNMFGSFAGGLGVVDVRDVAAIILKALSAGRVGERYLVVGANLAYPEVLRLIGRHAGRRVHPFRVPPAVFMAAGLALEAASRLTGRPPLLTSAYGRLSGWTTYYDAAKSRREFDHTYLPIDKTIEDACRFFEAMIMKS